MVAGNTLRKHLNVSQREKTKSNRIQVINQQEKDHTAQTISHLYQICKHVHILEDCKPETRDAFCVWKRNTRKSQQNLKKKYDMWRATTKRYTKSLAANGATRLNKLCDLILSILS